MNDRKFEFLIRKLEKKLEKRKLLFTYKNYINFFNENTFFNSKQNIC
jgi:hypothetical protein